MKTAAYLLTSLAILCGSSYAALLPQTFVFAQTAESFTQLVNLAQFDPSLGTLTGINVQIQGSSVSSATVTNTTGARSTTFTSSADLFLVDATLPALVYGEALPAVIATSVSAPGGATNFSLTAQKTSNTTYVPFSGTVFQGTADNGSPTPLISTTPFIGTGIYLLNFDGDDTSSCGPVGSGCTINSKTGGGTVTVTYVYNPSSVVVAPEPATFALCGLFAAGLPLLARRIRTNRR